VGSHLSSQNYISRKRKDGVYIYVESGCELDLPKGCLIVRPGGHAVVGAFAGRRRRWDGWAACKRHRSPWRLISGSSSSYICGACRDMEGSGEVDRGNSSYQLEKRARSRSTHTVRSHFEAVARLRFG